ncbi:ROK family transcriptional regulator [Agromyces binzhouensis]|uniref:ROK family transcriptional regulator n=1 Tax=Agromyces binzhouensis TaxID=1817495 RepID=UPI0013EACF3F|nr:ROK family transcriptional regulator [Agromyces binzhouensis]
MTALEGSTHVSDVLALIRDHGELTRTEVIELSGLSRSTINQRLATLSAAGLLTAVGGGESTGGRPSTRFAFNAQRAVVLAADIGATGFTAAACDLDGRPLAHLSHTIDVWSGPDAVLTAVTEAFGRLEFGDAEVWGVAIGVPGPVEYAARRVVNPPIMTGWDRFDIASWFTDRYDALVTVENDANARAVAEARLHQVDNVISLKLGTGIGAGLVFNGQIVRGDKGAAGDIGHTRASITDAEPRLCRCGNLDCVEAYAGGWALQRDLEAAGLPVTSTADVVSLVQRGDMEAVRRVRAAGRVIGDAIATLVSVLNPRTIALSGQLAECDEVLMSGIRERVHQHTVPLVTSDLTITKSTLGELAGVTGLALLTIDALFQPVSMERMLRGHA